MNRNGSVLVETLMALMMLSVCIVSFVGIFGNAATQARRIELERAGLDEVSRRVFVEFANSQGLPGAGLGSVVLPVGDDEFAPNLFCSIQTQKLETGAHSSSSTYFETNYRLLNRRDDELMQLNTVVYKGRSI